MGDTPTHGIDVWSAGCCLYELCTGTLPFTGDHNNGMLRQFMELCGRFPKKVLTRSKYTSLHFNSSYEFVCRTDNTTMHGTSQSFGKRSLSKELMSSKERRAHTSTPGGGVIISQVDMLSELLKKMFIIAPEKRLRANQILKESFFRSDKRSASRSGR